MSNCNWSCFSVLLILVHCIQWLCWWTSGTNGLGWLGRSNHDGSVQIWVGMFLIFSACAHGKLRWDPLGSSPQVQKGLWMASLVIFAGVIHRVLLPWKSGWKNLSVYMEVVYVQFLGKKWNWATGPANAEKLTVNLLHRSSSSDMSVTYSSWKCENWD